MENSPKKRSNVRVIIICAVTALLLIAVCLMSFFSYPIIRSDSAETVYITDWSIGVDHGTSPAIYIETDKDTYILDWIERYRKKYKMDEDKAAELLLNEDALKVSYIRGGFFADGKVVALSGSRVYLAFEDYDEFSRTRIKPLAAVLIGGTLFLAASCWYLLRATKKNEKLRQAMEEERERESAE